MKSLLNLYKKNRACFVATLIFLGTSCFNAVNPNPSFAIGGSDPAPTIGGENSCPATKVRCPSTGGVPGLTPACCDQDQACIDESNGDWQTTGYRCAPPDGSDNGNPYNTVISCPGTMSVCPPSEGDGKRCCEGGCGNCPPPSNDGDEECSAGQVKCPSGYQVPGLSSKCCDPDEACISETNDKWQTTGYRCAPPDGSDNGNPLNGIISCPVGKTKCPNNEYSQLCCDTQTESCAALTGGDPKHPEYVCFQKKATKACRWGQVSKCNQGGLYGGDDCPNGFTCECYEDGTKQCVQG